MYIENFVFKNKTEEFYIFVATHIILQTFLMASLFWDDRDAELVQMTTCKWNQPFNWQLPLVDPGERPHPHPPFLDCKTVVFFLKFSKENGKALRKPYF